MDLGSRVPESDFVSYTPRAQLFDALKKNNVSGENIQSLLKVSAVHQGLASTDANQSLKEKEEEEVDGMSLQSCFQISMPVFPHYASPEDSGRTKRGNVSAQSQISFLSDDCREMSLNVQHMSKSLLFDQLKRVPPALPPDQASAKLSDSHAAETVSQSLDSSGILHESSVRSDVKQIESAITPSDTEVPELLNSSNSKQTEYVKYTPEKLAIGRKGSGLKRKPYVKNPVVILSRISQSRHSIVRHDSDSVDDSHEREQFRTCSPFKTSNSQQVSDASRDGCAPVLVRSTLVPASSVSQGDALDRTSNDQGMSCSSSEIPLPNLLPSSEFPLSQNVAFKLKSNSSANFFNRKALMNVRHAAPLTADKVVRCSREEGIQVQSSSDEVFELRPTSMERTPTINQSGDNTDEVSDEQSLSKPTGSSKKLALHRRKQECRSLSSKGDPALIAENYLSPASIELQGGPHNVVELDKWTLRLVSGQHLCLAGYKKDKPGGRLHCSDPVTRRLRSDMVETTSGMLYHLSGRLCKSTATEAGLSNKFLHSFSDGFPPNWEDLLDSALMKRSSRMPVGYSPVQKDLKEAMPLSGPEMDNRRTCELVKKLKSATATNKSSVAESLSNKGSKNDPLTVQDLPVTRRSGRLVIPPLAWWANQRVMVDPTTNATSITQENRNMLDLPAVHFKQHKGKTTAEEVGKEVEERKKAEEVGEEEVEKKKKDLEVKEEKVAETEKQSVETCSKNQRGRPHKSTVATMQKMEIESSSSTDVVKDGQRTNSEGGQLKDGRSSEDSVADARLQTPRCRYNNHSDEVSVLGSYDNRRGLRKREQLVKVCKSCSASSVDTVSYRDQKRQKLSLKNYRDYQPTDFSSTEINSKRSVKSDLTVETSGSSRIRRGCNVESDNESPQTNSGESVKLNSKRSVKSDLTVETSGPSRIRRGCNVESDNELPQTNSGESVKINSKRSVKSDLSVETSGSSRIRRSCNVESDNKLPQTNSGESVKINSKRSVKSDLTVETSGSSRIRRGCNVESDNELPQTNSGESVKINSKRSVKSDLTVETSGSSRIRRGCNVESDNELPQTNSGESVKINSKRSVKSDLSVETSGSSRIRRGCNVESDNELPQTNSGESVKINSKRSVKSDLTVETSGSSRIRRGCNVESDNELPQTNSGESVKINSKRSVKSDLSVETSGSSRIRRSCNVESDNELPQTNSGESVKINSKRSVKSDLTVETSGSSRIHRSYNVESDSGVIKVPVQHGTKRNKTLTLQDSKVIRNSEEQTRQNSMHHCHEKQLSRKENGGMDRESEGSRKACSDSAVPSSHKTILRNENAEERGRQKKRTQKRSPKARSPDHKNKDVCSKPSSARQISRLNSDSEESLPAVEESGRKRTKKRSRKDLCSSESVELVYTKSERLKKGMTVMRHDSKKSRERSTTDPFSFLTKSPLLMQGLPPKPGPSLRVHASGNMSDFCESDDSANVEYFFSSDESET